MAQNSLLLQNAWIRFHRLTLRTFHRTMVDARIPFLRGLIRREGSLLDVGCGGLKQTTFDEVSATGDYDFILGVDACEQSIQERREWVGSRPDADRFRFVFGEIQGMTFDRRFDVVLMSHVIEHLSLADADKAVDYLWSICDGQMIVETPNEYEDGAAYVAESDNEYQRHLCLVDSRFMKSKGFKKVFTYFQPSGYSNTVYVRER